jgi:hypothetical protein
MLLKEMGLPVFLASFPSVGSPGVNWRLPAYGSEFWNGPFDYTIQGQGGGRAESRTGEEVEPCAAHLLLEGGPPKSLPKESGGCSTSQGWATGNL